MIGKNIRGAVIYNEQKVSEKTAQLIMASGFAGEIERMNLHQKVKRFEQLNMLNPRVKTNTLHISLNFHTSEQLSNQKLQQIAAAYMEKIGFGEQPFLVYRHSDTAHQHIHLVTTSLQRDGKPISLHQIGRLRSEPARKQIELEFGLVRAESKHFGQHTGIKPANPEKAVYGRIPTKRAISNIVTAVMKGYKYTSLAEFNVVLNQFNVHADRGKADMQMYQKKGLRYTLLDAKGNPVGVPVKASSLYVKPTLVNLEKEFAANAVKRKLYREGLKTEIDQVFKSYRQLSRRTFIRELAERNIHVLFRQNEQGFVYGLTFTDHRSRTVFNGSDLGKAYSAKAISGRLGRIDELVRPEQKVFLGTAVQKTNLPSVPDAGNYLKGWLGRAGGDPAPVVPRKKKKSREEDNSLDQQP